MPSRVADILLQAAENAARAREASGLAWAGLAHNLGQLPGQVMGQIGQQKQQALQEQRLGLESERVGLEVQAQQRKADAEKRALAMNATINDLMQQTMTTSDDGTIVFDRGKLRDAFLQHQVPLPQQEGVFKSLDEIDTSASKFATARIDHMADLAHGVLQQINAGADPETALTFGLAHAKANKLVTDDQVAPLIEHMASGGDLRPALLHMKGMSGKYKDEKPMVLPEGGTLVAPTGEVLARGTSKPMTPEQVALDAATLGTPQETPTAKQSKATVKLTQGPAMAAREETARHDAEMERIERLRVGRQAAADAETARHHQEVEKLTATGAAGGEGSAKDIADAIEKGLQPPDTRGLYRMGAPVRAELARRGYDLTHAQLDFQATQKHLATLNGAQQTRLRQAIGTASDSLGVIEDLAKQWDGGGFPPLNRVKLALAKNGGLGPKAQQIATNLEAQITDVTSELGNVYMGGNSPTDHALQLAGKNLSADWNRDQLLSAVKLARTNLQIRNNSIANASAITSSGVVPGPAAPSGATGAHEGEVKPIPGYPGTEQTFRNGKWIRTK